MQPRNTATPERLQPGHFAGAPANIHILAAARQDDGIGDHREARHLSGWSRSGVRCIPGCIAPWADRITVTFGQPVFLRSNFVLTRWVWTGANGRGWNISTHAERFEMERYRRLGEMAYVKERKQEAIDFIRQDYGRF